MGGCSSKTDAEPKPRPDLPSLDHLRSYSRPGESEIFVTPHQDIPPREIPELWYQVRKKLGDIRHTLAPGTIGPFFSDEFGDTYSMVYAFSADGRNGRISFCPAAIFSAVRPHSRARRAAQQWHGSTRRQRPPDQFSEVSERSRATAKWTKARTFAAARRPSAYATLMGTGGGSTSRPSCSPATSGRKRGIFLIDTPADVSVSGGEVRVRFHRRAHVPIIIASGMLDSPLKVPWWHNHTLRMSASGESKKSAAPLGQWVSKARLAAFRSDWMTQSGDMYDHQRNTSR
jgi:hypothetical protein